MYPMTVAMYDLVHGPTGIYFSPHPQSASSSKLIWKQEDRSSKSKTGWLSLDEYPWGYTYFLWESILNLNFQLMGSFWLQRTTITKANVTRMPMFILMPWVFKLKWQIKCWCFKVCFNQMLINKALLHQMLIKQLFFL